MGNPAVVAWTVISSSVVAYAAWQSVHLWTHNSESLDILNNATITVSSCFIWIVTIWYYLGKIEKLIVPAEIRTTDLIHKYSLYWRLDHRGSTHLNCSILFGKKIIYISLSNIFILKHFLFSDTTATNTTKEVTTSPTGMFNTF